MDREPRSQLNSLQVEEMGRLVAEHFARQGRNVRVSGYDVAYDDGTHGGLANLAQFLAAADPGEWAEVVEAHFTALAAETGRPASWEEAASQVRLRLYPAGHIPPDTGPVLWPVNDDLVVALMLEGSGAPVTASEADLTDWHVKPELAFDRGLHNSVEVEACAHEQEELEDGTVIHSITGGFSTTAHVLVLERHLGEAPHGALVSVPDPQTVLYHPVLDYHAVNAINVMADATSRRFEQSPYPVSSSLFWWRAGELTPLPATVDGGRVQFSPPEEFVRALDEVVESTKRKRRRFFGRG